MSTHRVTLNLPAASYQYLRKLVDSGEYASESEAVAGALLDVGLGPAPQPGEPAFERWMREEVLPAYDELTSNPDAGLTPEELRVSLEQGRFAKAQAR